MAWFGSKIKVTLIDDATGESFAVTEMPPADLPESFELDTILHLGNDDWSVVDAQPRDRTEYARSKALTLRLRRVEMMDSGDILYSLPSICDAIPGVNDVQLSGDEFVLAEDDWRQFEFISNDLASEVDDEIAKIRLIHENAAADVGWREIHVRSKPEVPLVNDFTLAELGKALNIPAESVGVTFHGAPSRIADGYALKTTDLTVYGVAPNGIVRTIAFEQYSDDPPSTTSVDLLKSLAQKLNVDLVYWCRCARVGPNDPLFVSLLTNDAT